MNALITAEEVSALARPIYADEEIVSSIIAESEREDIKPRIGDRLYLTLKTKGVDELTNEESLLLNGGQWTSSNGDVHYLEGLKTALAYFVYSRIVRDGNIQSTRYGARIKSDENSTSTEDTERQRQYRQAFASADRYLAECLAFINRNSSALGECGREKKMRSNRTKFRVVGTGGGAVSSPVCNSGGGILDSEEIIKILGYTPANAAEIPDMSRVYELPDGGIPERDLSGDVQDALAKGKTASSDLSTFRPEVERALSERVRYADVVDGLDSPETDKPLSANQGRVLKDGLTELGLKVDGLSSHVDIPVTAGQPFSRIIPVSLLAGDTFSVSVVGDNIGTQVAFYANSISTEIGRASVNGGEVVLTAPINMSNLIIFRAGTYISSSGDISVAVVFNKSLDDRIKNVEQSLMAEKAKSVNPFSIDTNIVSIDILNYSSFVFTLKLSFAYLENPYVSIWVNGIKNTINLSSFIDLTLESGGALVYDIATGSAKIIANGSSWSDSYINLLSIARKTLAMNPIFEGILSKYVTGHMIVSLANDDVTIEDTASYSTKITFNSANSLIINFNDVNNRSVTIPAGTNFTLAGAQMLILNSSNALEVVAVNTANATGGHYIPLLVHTSKNSMTGILMEAFIKSAYIKSSKIKNVYDFSVSVDNPYWSPSYQGSILYAEPLLAKGIFVKFDSLRFVANGTRLIKTWSDLKSDLASTGTFGKSSEVVDDCLLLSQYSYGSQILYYDFDTSKFMVKVDNQQITGNYIILANANGSKGDGIIGQQYENRLINNKSKFLDEVNISYIDEVREKDISILPAKDNFCFAFFSDNHYSITNGKGHYVSPTNAIVKDIDTFIGLDAILNGGDNIVYGSKSKVQGLTALFKMFDTIDLGKYVPCVGNHDFNSVADGGVTINTDEWIITNKELETLFFRKVETSARPNGKLYYYRDFEQKKVRIIVLDTMDVPIEFNDNGTIKYDPVSIHGLSQSQLEWLDSALDLTSKTDADAWKIVILMHVGAYFTTEGFTQNTNTLTNRLGLRAMLSAFVNRSSYSYSYTDTEHDGIFTMSINGNMGNRQGKLVAVLSGHAHADAYVNTDGFNAIQIDTSSCIEVIGRDPSPFTFDETCIDVVTLDDQQGKIVLKRFGYGSDREYPYDVVE